MGIERKALIVITGPTASGKTSLSVDAALDIKGEVVSADSRQIYKGMDTGTGKATKEEMKGVPHHLLDVCSVEEEFTVADYKKIAEEKIKEVQERGSVPILCGGTGFYIKAVVEGVVMPQVPPNEELRKELERKTKEELFDMLSKVDKRRAEEIEGKNKRKLIRAIEIVEKTGKPVPEIKKEHLPYPVLALCLDLPLTELEKKIRKRVEYMIEDGLEKEAKDIFKRNKYLARETIGYAEWEDYLKGEISIEEVKEKISVNTLKYAKAQKKWFKKEDYLVYIENKEEGIEKINSFLKKEGVLR